MFEKGISIKFIGEFKRNKDKGKRVKHEKRKYRKQSFSVNEDDQKGHAKGERSRKIF